MTSKTILAAAALMLTGVAGQAQATTLFDDMGTNNSFGSANHLISSAWGQSSGRPEFQFTATATGSLSEIDMALFGYSIPGGVNAVLMSSVANAPGQVLGSFALGNLPTASGFSIANATGITGITLTAGTTYYLGAQATGGLFGNTMYGWADNTTGVSGRVSELVGTRSYNLGTDTTGAFRLVGATSPVPEPASWAMMLVGVGMLGYALRRRRARSAGAVSAA